MSYNRYMNNQIGQSPEDYNGPMLAGDSYGQYGTETVQIIGPGSSPAAGQPSYYGDGGSVQMYGPSQSPYGQSPYVSNGQCPPGYIADGYGNCYGYSQGYGSQPIGCPACPPCAIQPPAPVIQPRRMAPIPRGTVFRKF